MIGRRVLVFPPGGGDGGAVVFLFLSTDGGGWRLTIASKGMGKKYHTLLFRYYMDSYYSTFNTRGGAIAQTSNVYEIHAES